MIVGGEDHKTGQDDSEQAFDRLLETAQKTAPDATWERRWSGQVIEPVDGLPFIGPAGENQFIATGFSGNGMTFGTLAAVMARDWALSLRNPWSDLFAVERKKLSSAWDYIAENKDYPYYLLKGTLEAASTSDLADVPPCEGRIVRIDGRKWTAFRSEDGTLHVRSAVCPHLGCIVEWNQAEKTWDCPCHGSRFDAKGAVIAGPAESPLANREEAPSSAVSATR
jgi:Rieske Fe-S protein